MGGEFQGLPERVEKTNDGKTEDVMAGARAEAFKPGDTATGQANTGDASQGAAFAATFADANSFGGAAAEQALKNMKNNMDPDAYELLMWARQDPDSFKKALAASQRTA